MDLTQKEIANMLNCSQTTYSRYETGDLNVPNEVLKQLAKFYKTSVDYILGITNDKKPYKRNR